MIRYKRKYLILFLQVIETSLQLGEIESNQMIKEKKEAIDSIVRKIHQKLRVIL